ncbi:MAG: sulfotransferase domain-containing protein, partial [Bacteroidota bacterium]
MIWLASFPRSGNTFFRNVLYEVYGLESSTFHRDPQRDLDNRYSTFPVVKTHDLPTLIEPKSKDIKAVYIIRDGRDSLVSIAHHRKDIVEQGSDFYNNLLEAILARNGSHFGGWSENVRQWVERADLVVRFEDLIRDPLSQVERLREIMDLPEPNRDKLPSFQDLKFGKPRYGGGKGKRFQTSKAQLHFRKGKVGSWKEEMPPELEALFWKQHGKMMEEWGYEREPLTQASKNAKAKKRVLIEVSKLFTHDNDGVKRYLLELIEHLPVLLEHQKDEWHVDLYHNNRVQPLHNIRMKLEERGLSNFHQPNSIEKAMGQQHEYENRLLQLKAGIKSTLPQPVYNTLSYSYKKLPIRAALRWYRNLVTTEKVKVAQTKQDQQFNSYDLIHVPLPQNLPFVKDLESRFLVTVHDLTHRLFPKFHTPDNIERAEDGMQMMLEKEAEVLAISKATKRDVQKLYNIDEDKVHLVYEAANTGHFRKRDESALKAVQIQYNLPDVPYLMCLSTIEPRKNLLNTA